MPEKLRLTHEDLYSPQVDEIVAEQQALARALPGFQPTPLWRKILFSSLFFLSWAGLIGGLIGWAIMEPYLNEGTTVWGTIDDIELPATGGSQSRILVVRGHRIFADPRISTVRGRGEYAGLSEVDDLRVGLPIQAQTMIGGDTPEMLWGVRIVARTIPPEHENEPWPDLAVMRRQSFIAGLFLFATVGACVAGLIAAADGVMSRNLRRAVICALCGVGIAAAGGMVILFPAGIVFALTASVVMLMSGGIVTSSSATGFPLVILAAGRSLAWGMLGLTVGLGQGAAMRSKKLALNGMLGGMLGAVVGGALFDPICKAFANTEASGQAVVSRAVGFAIIGLSAGFMIGLVEHLAKDAWLLMRAGPLMGKQFILYKNPTAIGSSPKCEIYLFKDPDVEPRHALIHQAGTRHEIQDLKSASGTFLNGRPVSRQPLRDGDQIVIGKTVLEYSERARGQR